MRAVEAFTDYAKWVEKITDDYDEPLLVMFPKVLVFMLIPMMVMIVVALVLLVVGVAVAVQLALWLWDLVWI